MYFHTVRHGVPKTVVTQLGVLTSLYINVNNLVINMCPWKGSFKIYTLG